MERLRRILAKRLLRRSVTLALIGLALVSFLWSAEPNLAAPSWQQIPVPSGIAETVVINDITTGFDRIGGTQSSTFFAQQYEAWAVGTDISTNTGVVLFYTNNAWTTVNLGGVVPPPLDAIEAVNVSAEHGWHVVAVGTQNTNLYRLVHYKTPDPGGWVWEGKEFANPDVDADTVTDIAFDGGLKRWGSDGGGYRVSFILGDNSRILSLDCSFGKLQDCNAGAFSPDQIDIPNVAINAIAFPDRLHGWAVGTSRNPAGNGLLYQLTVTLDCTIEGTAECSVVRVNPPPPLRVFPNIPLLDVKAKLQQSAAVTNGSLPSNVWIAGSGGQLFFFREQDLPNVQTYSGGSLPNEDFTSIAVAEQVEQSPDALGIQNVLVNPNFEADRDPPAHTVPGREARNNIPYGWTTTADVPRDPGGLSQPTVTLKSESTEHDTTVKVQGLLRRENFPVYFFFHETEVDNNYTKEFKVDILEHQRVEWALGGLPFPPLVLKLREIFCPPTACGTDHYYKSIRIQGFINVPAGVTALVQLRHENGARLYLDQVQNGQQDAERWGDPVNVGPNTLPTLPTPPISLSGGVHPFRIDYQQFNNDRGQLILEWNYDCGGGWCAIPGIGSGNLPPDPNPYAGIWPVHSKVYGMASQYVPGSETPGRSYRVSGWVKVEKHEDLFNDPMVLVSHPDHPLYHFPFWSNDPPQPHVADSLHYAGIVTRCSEGSSGCGYGNTTDGVFEDDRDWQRVSFTVTKTSTDNKGLEVQCVAHYGYTAWCDDFVVEELPLQKSEPRYTVWAVTATGKVVSTSSNFAAPPTWTREDAPSDSDVANEQVPLTAVAAAAPHQAWIVGGDVDGDGQNNGPFLAKLTPGNVIGWGWFGADACSSLMLHASEPVHCDGRQTPVGWVSFSCANGSGTCANRPFGFGVNVQQGPEMLSPVIPNPNLGALSGNALLTVTGGTGVQEQASKGRCLKESFGACIVDYQSSLFHKCDDDRTLFCDDNSDCENIGRCSNNRSFACPNGTDAECETSCLNDPSSCQSTAWLTFDRLRTGRPPDPPFNGVLDTFTAQYDAGTSLVSGWARLNVGQCSLGRCTNDTDKSCTMRNECADGTCVGGQCTNVAAFGRSCGDDADCGLCTGGACTNIASRACASNADCLDQAVECEKTACYNDTGAAQGDCDVFNTTADNAVCEKPGGGANDAGWVKLRSAEAKRCSNSSAPCFSNDECPDPPGDVCTNNAYPPMPPLNNCQNCEYDATPPNTCKLCTDNRGYQVTGPPGTDCEVCTKKCWSLDVNDPGPRGAGVFPCNDTGAPSQPGCSYWGVSCSEDDDCNDIISNGTNPITGNVCATFGQCYGGDNATWNDPPPSLSAGLCFDQTHCDNTHRGECRNIGATCERCNGLAYRYGVSVDDETGFFKGFGYSEDLGYLDFSQVSFGGVPWLQTKLGDIYTGGFIGSAAMNPPPAGQATATFLIAANGSIFPGSVTTEKCPTCQPVAPPFLPPTPGREFFVENFGKIVFPGIGKCNLAQTPCVRSSDCLPNEYCDKVSQSALASIDYQELVRDDDPLIWTDSNRYGTVYQTIEGDANTNNLRDPQSYDPSGPGSITPGLAWDTPDPDTGENRVCLNGYIWHVTGDLTIDKPLHFTNNTDDIAVGTYQPYDKCGPGRNGAGLVVVEGNLTIEADMQYDINIGFLGTNIVQSTRNLASLGFLVLGNVVIKPRVNQVAGSFFVNGGVTTESLSLQADRQLKAFGMFAARWFQFRRKYSGSLEQPKASERFIYDGRIEINPPPGFQDLRKSLPIIRDVAP